MPTESVKFVISAEDQASAKLAATGAAMGKVVTQVKGVAQPIRATTGVVDQLATALGHSAFGSFANQAGAITGQVAGMSSALKSGAIGALAFKAGIAALAITIGVNLGKALADWALGLTKINEESEKAIQTMNKMSSEVSRLRQKQFAGAESPEERAKLAEASGKRQAELMETEKKQIAELASMKEEGVWGWGGYSKEALAAQQAAIDNTAAQIDAEKQLMEVARDRAKEDKKAANEKKMKAFDDALTGGVKSGWDAVIKSATLAHDQREKADKAAEVAAKRLLDLKKDTVEGLKQELIALRDGEGAAKAYALTLQGIDEKTANQIASVQMMIDEVHKSRDKSDGGQRGPNTATESRMLTGRVAMDHTKTTALNTERTAKQLEKMNAEALPAIEKAIKEIQFNTIEAGD